MGPGPGRFVPGRHSCSACSCCSIHGTAWLSPLRCLCLSANGTCRRVQSGALVSAGFAGQFVGAIIFGAIAERLRAAARPQGAGAGHEPARDCLRDDRQLRAAHNTARRSGTGHRRCAALCHLLHQRNRANRDARALLRHVPVPDDSGFGLASLVGAVLVPAFGWRDHVRTRRGAAARAALHAVAARITSLARRQGSHRRRSTIARERLGSGPLPDLTAADTRRRCQRVPLAHAVRARSAQHIRRDRACSGS